ncbi:MAG: alpha/beta hydrolase [Clostridia bacterium]|nr:alpha/beta hydrolase [Clostridia bacterium]
MYHEKIRLRKEDLPDGYISTITTYMLDVREGDCTRPGIVVFPGGGYSHCSEREAERIALGYNAAGFNAFVVNYALAPNRHPEQIKDAASAVKFVRENAEKYNVNPEQIAVVGFSAGGHLAASISTLWNDTEIFTGEEIKNELHKPNASILAYPVITSGEFAHRGSFNNLLGEDASEDMLLKMSLETRVGSHTPPTFLWHTYEDMGVPVENSLLYAMSLSKYRVPCEMHIYPQGPHGLSLVSHETLWSVSRFRRKYDWLAQSVEWLIDLFGLKYEN